jgi:uncharacterized protein (TIGR02598 family)
VEVAISIAIVGFALISLLGLVPFGLASYKQSVTNTVESQIVQAITGDLELTSFSNFSQTNANYVGNQTYSYDAYGNALTSSGTAVYTATVSVQNISTSATGTTPTFPVNLPNQAYDVQIQVTNKTQPSQPHTYSVIIANKNS